MEDTLFWNRLQFAFTITYQHLPDGGRRSRTGHCVGLVADHAHICRGPFSVHLPALRRQCEAKRRQSKSILIRHIGLGIRAKFQNTEMIML